jgi:hypothetical protein
MPHPGLPKTTGHRPAVLRESAANSEAQLGTWDTQSPVAARRLGSAQQHQPATVRGHLLGRPLASEHAVSRSELHDPCVCTRSGILRLEPDSRLHCVSRTFDVLGSQAGPQRAPNLKFQVRSAVEVLTAVSATLAAYGVGKPEPSPGLSARSQLVATTPLPLTEDPASAAGQPSQLPVPQLWVKRVLDTAAHHTAADADATIDCHGECVPVSAVDTATLTGKGALVHRSGRVYLRARSTTGHSVAFLVKPAGDLRRDQAWQGVLHAMGAAMSAQESASGPCSPVPTYGVLPSAEGHGGLVVLLPGSVSLFALWRSADQNWPGQTLTTSTEGVVPDPPGFEERAAASPRLVLQRLLCGASRSAGCWEWFAATRVMVASIAVGAVLGAATGLGDRHLANMVLGPKSHVMHVDLQMLFGDGALLPVPETVPFRFTPILTDAAGSRPEAFGPEFAKALRAWHALKSVKSAASVAFAELEARSHSKSSHDALYRRKVYHPDLPSGPAAFIGLIAEATKTENLRLMHSSWMPWV